MEVMHSLVISIILYACESWNLTTELEKRMQAFEMRSYRRLLNISYKDHITIEEVPRKIQEAIGEYNELSAECSVAHAGIKSHKFLFVLKKIYFAVLKKLMD